MKALIVFAAGLKVRVSSLKNKIQTRIARVFQGQPFQKMQAHLFYGEDKQQKKITLRLQRYPELDSFFKKLSNSRQMFGIIHNQDLAFLIGAPSSGKTTYALLNLQQIRRMKQKQQPPQLKFSALHRQMSYEEEILETTFANQHSLLITQNYQCKKMLSFKGFIHDLHEQIIKQILSLKQSFPENTLIDPMTVWQIITAQNAPEYIYINLKDVIYCILNGTDYIKIDQEGIKALDQLNDKLYRVPYTEFISNGSYLQVVSIIRKHSVLVIQSTEQAVIRLFVSIGRRIQYEQRGQVYITGQYVSGIESTDMLLDILNFLCGLGKFNKKFYQEVYKQVQLPKQRNNSMKQNQITVSKEQSLQRFVNKQTNFIKSGNHIDVMLTFLNIDGLVCFDSTQFIIWLDHIVARVRNPTSLRRHFPILIQLPNKQILTEIQNVGQISIANPVVIEIPGYTKKNIKESNVGQHFSQKVLSKAYFAIGKSHHTWNKAIQALVQGTPFQQITSHKAAYIKREAIGLVAKLNSIFIDRNVQKQLAQGTLHAELSVILRNACMLKGIFMTFSRYYFVQSYSRPVFQALLRSGAMYESYYTTETYLYELTLFEGLCSYAAKLYSDNILSTLKWKFLNPFTHFYIKRHFKYAYNWQKEVGIIRFFPKQKRQYHLQETYFTSFYAKKQTYGKKGWHSKRKIKVT